MKKRESLLWAKIRNLKLIGQIFRIESNTINGIPTYIILAKASLFGSN